MPSSMTDRLYGLTTSVAVKAPVRAVASSNIDLEGLQTVGGVVLASEDRVLVKGQTDAAENGIYLASASEWQRAADFDGLLDVVKGTLVVDESETALFYRVTSDNPIRPGTDDIEFETVATAITQTSLGLALYPFSAAEASAGLEQDDIAQPWVPYWNSDRYGVNAIPGTTDMAVAVQRAINVASHAGYGDVEVPRGLCDLQDDIYFYYDAVNNPGFSNDTVMGMVNVVGHGWQDFGAYQNDEPQGSILDINANQFKIGDGAISSRGVRFKNCTVHGDSADFLIRYDKTSRGSGFEDFTLFQAGVGGGIEMDDTFNIVLKNVFAATDNGASVGTGLYIHNSSQAAGDYDLSSVSMVGFNKNWVLGEEGTSASSMSNIVMDCCQGKDGNYNLIIGNGAKSALINSFHNEGPQTTGIVVAYGARHIRLETPYNSNVGASGDYMSLGLNTGTDAADYCADVSVLHGTFLDITNVGIRVYTSASVINREIAYCRFVGNAGTETAIDLEDAAQHGLTIGPNTYSNVATEVSNPTRVDVLRAGDTLGSITYRGFMSLLGGGLASELLVASSGTINAAAILQADSTTRGFLPPRMTEAQRDAISAPPAGLLVYNTTTNKLNLRVAAAWEVITSA